MLVDEPLAPLLGCHAFHPPHGASAGAAQAKPSKAAPIVKFIADIMTDLLF